MAADTEHAFAFEFFPESLIVTKSRNLFGDLWIRCGDKTWPGPGYNDFPVTCLATWKPEMEKLVQGKAGRFRFADDPKGFDLLPTTGGDCRIRPWKSYVAGEREDGTCIDGYEYQWECRVPLRDAIAAMVDFAERVFAAFPAMGWPHNDLFEGPWRNFRLPPN